MILKDPYALHRRWWDESWQPGLTSKDWTDWDYVLADVYQIIEDYTDDRSGQIMWFDQSGEVDWDVDKVSSGSLAAIEAAEEKNNLKAGERYYAKPTFRDPDNKPTMAQWLKDVGEGKADGRPSQHRNARPPTTEELAAIDNQLSTTGKLESDV